MTNTSGDNKVDSREFSSHQEGNDLYKDVARLGNGKDEELSKEQLDMIDALYDRVLNLRNELSQNHPHDSDFCDHETCRRYLVARQWNLKKAEAQLKSTLEWRLEESPSRLSFGESLEDPFSLSMRIIGLDIGGRPIAYTCFAESYDRWDVDTNLKHMILLMEATCRLLKQRRDANLNETASSRQWVWVVDFDGFGLRDQNPKSSYHVARVMQHYPEMLHLCVLLNAPKLFSGIYRLVSPVLDERVRRKILFENKKTSQEAVETLKERVGAEATEWIMAETRDNLEKRPFCKTGNRKRYWMPPNTQGEHDARGMSSYVNSPYYIKTPGDAYLERNTS